MDDVRFLSRVQAAAAAAWWTLLIAWAVLMVQWLLYLLLMQARPAWVVGLWGPGETWETIRPVWFNALLLFKLGLVPVALAAIWLTLWARQLRKA